MRYFCSIWLLSLIFLQSHIFTQTPIGQPEIINSQAELNPSQESKFIPQNLIHFGDLIDVDVIGSTEFDWRGTLTPEGFLNGVDFVEEPILGLCRSEEEVPLDIVKGYQRLLRNPQVVVKILDRSGRPISYLYGAVKIPQRFKIQREIRLNELIILSGGITEKASGEVQIIRSSRLNCEDLQNERDATNSNIIVKQEIDSRTINIRISELLKGDKNANPLILSGDIITILEADPIYVIGGVSNPRQINSRSQMTISRAIDSAGGFAKGADQKNITVFRREKKETKLIEVNFEQIKANLAEDVILQKFDIVKVRQIGSAKRKFPPIVKNADSLEKTLLEMPLRVID